MSSHDPLSGMQMFGPQCICFFFSSCKTAVHSQLWEPRWKIVTFSQKEKFSFETSW